MISQIEERAHPVRAVLKQAACTCGTAHLLSTSDQTRLSIALALMVSFFAAEGAIAAWSHSLSLLADAGHLILDVGSLGLTLAAAWLSARPAAGAATFGYGRIKVLAALLNGISLLAVAGWVMAEAIARLQQPEPILALPMLIGASLGLLVNSLNLGLLSASRGRDLNLRGAMLHLTADLASSVGVLLAALALHCWGWAWVDAAASLLVAGFTGWSALPLIKSSLEVLMEYAPSGVSPAQIETAMMAFDEVQKIRNLQVWTLNAEQVFLCAEITVRSQSREQRDRLLWRLKAYLKQEFGVDRAVLEISDRSIEPLPLHPLLNQSLTSVFAGKHGEQKQQ